MKKEEEERRRFEQTHRTMIGVRQEMKRTNDIMSSFVEDQRRNGIDEKIFMALQVLPKESVEYRSLSRQLVSSISGRNVVDENGQQDDDNNQAQDEVIEDPVQRRRMNTTRHHANERRYLHLHNSQTTDEPYVPDASRHSNPQRSYEIATQASTARQHVNRRPGETAEVAQRRTTGSNGRNERRNDIYHPPERQFNSYTEQYPNQRRFSEPVGVQPWPSPSENDRRRQSLTRYATRPFDLNEEHRDDANDQPYHRRRTTKPNVYENVEME